MNTFENLVAFRYLLSDKRRWHVLVLSLLLLAAGGAMALSHTAHLYFPGMAMAAVGAFGTFLGVLLLFFNVYTAISIFGVFLGSAVLLVVLSIMGGLEDAQKEQILGYSPHILVRSRDYELLREDPSVEATIRSVMNDLDATGTLYAYLDTEVLAKSTKYDASSGMILRGIRPTTDDGLELLITEGTLSNLTDPDRVKWLDPSIAGAGMYGPTPPTAPVVCLSKDQATVLGVAALGSGLDIISPKGELTPTGLMPRLKRFRVGCVFDTGDFRFDRKFIITPLQEVRTFLGERDALTGWQIRLADTDRIEAVAASLRTRLPQGLAVDTWRTRNRALFNAMELERVVMFLVLAVIILVAAFSITANLIMVVLDKRSEIAILKALGATDGAIVRIFTKQGLFIGLIGLGAGLAAAFGICSYLAVVGMRMPMDVFQFAYLPVRLDVAEVLAVTAATLALSLLATIYPARRAAAITPVEGLKHDDA